MAVDFSAQPLFAPIAGLLRALICNGEPPDVAVLNERAEQSDLRNSQGRPIRFVIPGGSGLSYEERIYWLGEVETRPGNWHDLLNAVVWLTFPRSKTVLNARHHAARAALRSAGRAERGPLRDALTHFDECGAVVVSDDPTMWSDIRAHRWKELFWLRRGEVVNSLRLFVFGHATYDTLRTPHIGLCAKAIFLPVTGAWTSQGLAAQLEDIDRRLADRFGSDHYARPRDFAPLPLLGVPGATADNEYPAYYEDTRQFRPLRAVR